MYTCPGRGGRSEGPVATPLSTPGATGAGTEPGSHQLISLKLFLLPPTFTNLMYFTVTTVMGLAGFFCCGFLLPLGDIMLRFYTDSYLQY